MKGREKGESDKASDVHLVGLMAPLECNLELALASVGWTRGKGGGQRAIKSESESGCESEGGR